MKRKVILNLAISLDGYIASETGGFEWIVGDGDNSLDTENQFSFEKFLDDVDVVVFGKKAYDDCGIDMVKDKKIFVATSKDIEDYDNVRFISGNVVKVILAELEQDGKNIYLFGGGGMTDAFIKANIIDEYIIGIVPTILGSGVKLFLDNNPNIKLHLEEVTSTEGIVIMRYNKK